MVVVFFAVVDFVHSLQDVGGEKDGEGHKENVQR